MGRSMVVLESEVVSIHPLSPWNHVILKNVSVDGGVDILFQDLEGGLSLTGICGPDMHRSTTKVNPGESKLFHMPLGY